MYSSFESKKTKNEEFLNKLGSVRSQSAFSIFFTLVAVAAYFHGESAYEMLIFVFMSLLFQISIFTLGKKLQRLHSEIIDEANFLKHDYTQ